MIRKLALALVLAACLGLTHGSAWALGLGDIQVESSLNERFSAEIELRRIEGLSTNEIIATLASAEDFARLGVQRFFYLSELEFSTDLEDRSNPRIRISSNRPINEPFVNFVVDVRWPTGRLLREYTVLLDPPAHARQPQPAPRVAEPAPPARETAREPTRVRTDPTPAAEPPPAQEVGRFDGETYGVTGRNDTLWEVALRVRPSSEVSVQQTMLALQRLNPEAFIGGNINLLRAGHVLQVPSRSEIERLSLQDAVVQVSEHNNRWRQGTPAMPMDARPEVARPDAAERPSGELRLVAGEDDEARVTEDTAAVAGAGRAADGAVAELRDELAAAEQRASRAQEAREAAERRLEETNRQVEELSRQLELSNAELARLQRQLAEQPTAATAAASTQGPFGLSWLMLSGLLAALVLVVAAVLVMMRRRQEDDDALSVAARGAGPSAPMERTLIMPSVSQEDMTRAGAATTGAAAAATGLAAANLAGDDESDVIAEADVYMAYGRFSEAARVLESAIDQDDQRADLRLKLMEVQIETQDVDGFNAQAEALRSFADDDTIELVDDMAARLPGALTSTGDLSQGEDASPRTADEGEVNLDFDLGEEFGAGDDLDSLDIDLDVSQKAGAAAAATAAPAAAAADDDEPASADDLTLSLDGDAADDDLDLELDAAFGEVKADDDQPVFDEEEFDLALDLDGDDEDATQLRATPVAAGEGEAEGESAVASDDEPTFDLELPAASDDATGPRTAARDDAEFNITNFTDEPFDTSIAGPGTDPEEEVDFDLRLDGDASGAAVADPGDEDFDLGSDDPQPRMTEASGTGDDDIDFALDDMPAETSEADDDFSSTIHRAPAGDDEELTSTASRAPSDDDSFESTLNRTPDASDDDFARTIARAPDDASDESGQGAAAAFDDAASRSGDGDGARALPVDLADDDLELELDLGDVGDETSTKLELARAYIDMGDEDGAREILDEVVRDGNMPQQQEAGELLSRLG